MSELFGILASLIVVAGAPFYLIDILKGKTKPQRTTWFIWSVLGITAFTAQVQLHGGWSLLNIGLEAAGNLALFALSFKYGEGGWSRVDKIALCIATIGIAASLIERQPTLALLGVVLADGAGAVLTVRKAYLKPTSETPITWLFLGIASFLTAAAVGKLQLNLLLYPVYLGVADFVILAAQGAGYYRQRRMKHSKATRAR